MDNVSAELEFGEHSCHAMRNSSDNYHTTTMIRKFGQFEYEVLKHALLHKTRPNSIKSTIDLHVPPLAIVGVQTAMVGLYGFPRGMLSLDDTPKLHQ